MTFQDYNDANELRKLQLTLVYIFKELIRVCELLDITYFAWAGIAIGAVRHKGFIPWDDDIDLLMTRSDYEKFLKEAPSLLKEEFEIKNSYNEVNYISPISALTLRNTINIPFYFQGCKYRIPIGIDIFPLDNIPDSKKEYRKKLRGTWLFGRLLYLTATPAPLVEFDGIKKKAVHFACSIAHKLLSGLGINAQKIQKQYDKYARMYEKNETSLVAPFTEMDPLAWSASKEELFPPKQMEFEGFMINMPANYDAILRRGYGNYMELPPLEKRKNHRAVDLDFGNYEINNSL